MRTLLAAVSWFLVMIYLLCMVSLGVHAAYVVFELHRPIGGIVMALGAIAMMAAFVAIVQNPEVLRRLL